MSSILSILGKWGINIPEDKDYVEFLRNYNQNNFFYIDQCPFAAGDKHSQVDMFFQEVLDGTLSKHKFMSLELKYRNIVTKIW